MGLGIRELEAGGELERESASVSSSSTRSVTSVTSGSVFISRELLQPRPLPDSHRIRIQMGGVRIRLRD